MRPKFARKVNKGQFGAEFSEGLDDIDDDGNIKNKPKKEFSKAEGGGGQREFVNLGSKARVDRPEDFKRDEPLMKTTGIKPTFRGKLNLNKGAAAEDEGDFGVKTNYGFAVSYKTDQPSGFMTDGKERKPRVVGVPFGEHMAKKAEEVDDDFQVVKEKERKPRVFNRDNSDDEGQEGTDGTKITRGDVRGDARGGRGGAERGGRGGFFKNSAKREE
jgi:hypothetical protein